jgi:hypothetical protein
VNGWLVASAICLLIGMALTLRTLSRLLRFHGGLGEALDNLSGQVVALGFVIAGLVLGMLR